VSAEQSVLSSEHRIDPFEIIDRSRVSALQVWVLAICLLTAMFDGFNTQAPAFIGAPMAKEWGIPLSGRQSAPPPWVCWPIVSAASRWSFSAC
jgi:hypothetical protein